MSDFFRKCGDLTQDVDVQAAILTPLLLGHEGSFDKNSLSITTVPLLLISLLGFSFFVLFTVL
jgi:hypothetical protein